MKKQTGKKGIAYLMTLAMTVGLLAYAPYPMAAVHAEETATTEKTIAGLGTSVIADPTAPESDSDAWKGSYVYFGTYDYETETAYPVKYRVLDSNTTVFGDTTMFLDCDSILWADITGDYESSAFDTDSNVWADSDIRAFLNGTFLTKYFSTAEQNAIAESTVESHELMLSDGVAVDYSTMLDFKNYVALDKDKVFLLDAEDVSNTAYGYSRTPDAANNKIKTNMSDDESWWLRSAYANNTSSAGYIENLSGDIFVYEVVGDLGVSPALNVNLSSVLFTSVISGTAGETGAEYKLTLIDDDMTIAVTENGTVTRSGDTATIPYSISGTNSSNATQISVLILDREYSADTKDEAEVLYYGALNTSAEDGTGTFTIPSELLTKSCGSDYYAYIVAEDVNGTYETDYASEPVAITIPWEAPTVNVINIGTPGIIDPAKPNSTSDAWTGCYVYFGTYDTDGNGIAEPVKYRVLDRITYYYGGGGGDFRMLLDCDSVLWKGSDPSSAFDADSKVWADSDIRAYLNGTFLTNNFSTVEQNAIAESTKKVPSGRDGVGRESSSYTSVNDDKIFFLDAKEATNTSYGYSNTVDEATNRVKTGGGWWLRSAHDSVAKQVVDLVATSGKLRQAKYSITTVGVSPAFTLHFSSILFSSASGTSKSSALTADSSQIGTTTGPEWKLTLSDAGKTIGITDKKVVSKAADGTITVPYTYTDTATLDTEKVNQISVLITDKAYTERDAAILYYGALQGTSFNGGGATGTGTFVLPSSLTGTLGTDYHVYILAEHVNSDNATDYASAPVEITKIYNVVSSVAVTDIAAPQAGAALDTEAACATVGIADATPFVTWKADGEEAAGNANYNTAYTASVTLSLAEGYVWADTVTATVNGESANAVKNEEGTVTITVTYEFPATEKQHECVDTDSNGVCDDETCKKLINGVALRASNCTLNGNIGLNFYFEIEESVKDTIFANETAMVRFTLADGRVIEIAANAGIENTKVFEGTTLYKYPCELYAKQMADTVTVQFIMDNTVIVEYEHSVADYAKVIIANTDNKYSAEVIALVKAMLNYGSNAQVNFNYNTANLANSIKDADGNAMITEEEKKLDSVTVDTFVNYKASGMTVEGLGSFAGSNLVLESETTLKVYFSPAEGITLDELTFKVGENTVTATESGNYYVIAITNIKAKELDTVYTITVSDGTTTGTFAASVFTYCYSVLNDAADSFSEELKNTVKALYLYNAAADNY